MNTSTSYEYGGVKPADINNGTMDVVEAEVYSVTGTYCATYIANY